MADEVVAPVVTEAPKSTPKTPTAKVVKPVVGFRYLRATGHLAGGKKSLVRDKVYPLDYLTNPALSSLLKQDRAVLVNEDGDPVTD